ncbi:MULTISPECIES: replication restart helicase PriA [unclassified Halobacteriovorax]|uniref:replication restart helicase PriA n=1 Tax=unclassified Halobacteriovorax TaxID=2639665 RepID=UPI003999C5C7
MQDVNTLNAQHYCQVAVDYPKLPSVLTYKTLGEEIPVGTLVEVPLGRRKAKGVVVPFTITQKELEETITKYKLRPINEVLAPEFSLSQSEMKLYDWMSRYYHYNLGQLAWDCLPKILKRPREVETQFGDNQDFEHELSPLQKPIYESINAKLDNGFDRFLVHGVTGSGKTLIYLHLIKNVLKKGKSVLFLLPEINLTPQFMETFKKYLDCPILPYHSGVTPSHKNAIWKFLKKSDRPVLLMGVRSSVFLPVENLGLVIVDEEHDSSFKQTDRCPYNGRDVAIKKAQLFNAPVVLGSATPSLENYFTFSKLKPENYFSLEKRVAGGFPEIELLDSRSHGAKKDMDALSIWPFEKKSLDMISEALDRDEQVLVFVNRLGFSNYLQCRGCGYKFEDPNTGVPLRYFKNKNILSSSHSDYQIPRPEICPECGNMNLLQKGFGTERLQEVLQEFYPTKKIERFDRDEITNLDKLEDKLERFHKGDIDIFVGTQMLSKGHNFKKVNLVLILGTDSMLNFPDFRAMEKAYQMIVQILGRAGRYSNHAKVAIQTMLPDNTMFDFIKSHSFSGFYDFELTTREFGLFPPYTKMANIHVSGRDRDKIIANLSSEIQKLRGLMDQLGIDGQVWGPTPAMIERRANMFTWSMSLMCKNGGELNQVLQIFRAQNKIDYSFSVKIDVDPMDT